MEMRIGNTVHGSAIWRRGLESKEVICEISWRSLFPNLLYTMDII